jgi:hypothetical protein
MPPAPIGRLANESDTGFGKDQGLVSDWKLGLVQDNIVQNLVEKEMPARVVGQFLLAEGSNRPAIELSGEGYLEVAHDKRLDLASGGTLAAWICPRQQGPGGGRIIDKSQVGTSNGYLLDTFPDNSLRLITERGTLSFDAKLQPDLWVHVAATVDAEGRLALYINGKQVVSKKEALAPNLDVIDTEVARIRRFHQGLVSAGLADSYEAAHARLVIEYQSVTCKRFEMLSEGKIKRLSGPSQYAADTSYLDTTSKLCEGLKRTVESYKENKDAHKKRVYTIWSETDSQPRHTVKQVSKVIEKLPASPYSAKQNGRLNGS